MYSIILICVSLILIGILHDGDALHSGNLSQEGQFPHAVHLQAHGYIFDSSYGSGYGYRTWSCGGVILDKYHILTAAHRVPSSVLGDYTMIAGAVDVNSGMGISRRLKTIHRHPKYVHKRVHGCLKRVAKRPQCALADLWQKTGLINDIAVLTLTESLPLGGNIEIVDLLPDGELQHCAVYYFTGWAKRNGYISDWSLKFINLEIVTSGVSANCSQEYKMNEFIAFDPSKFSHSERRDGGGGLVADNNVYGIRPIIYGIASRGICYPGCPVVFAKVFDHIDFIKSAINDIKEPQFEDLMQCL